eukprot:snap_masked-scaffold_17-processed-gene-4.20-mRNA-1 protein AED:1.00 eAED:1.00 QI:0/-1/0/0/-1/1/1/0/132
MKETKKLVIQTLFPLFVFIICVLQVLSQDLLSIHVDTSKTQNKERIQVANIGIIYSAYNPDELSYDELISSGLPENKFSSLTLSFPLLFPARRDLVSQTIPIDSEIFSSFGQFGIEYITDRIKNIKNITSIS